MLVPTNYWNISFQKKLLSKYIVCCQKKNFQWYSRVCQIKYIKYIHQNLRYYETLTSTIALFVSCHVVYTGNQIAHMFRFRFRGKFRKNKHISLFGRYNIQFENCSKNIQYTDLNTATLRSQAIVEWSSAQHFPRSYICKSYSVIHCSNRSFLEVTWQMVEN